MQPLVTILILVSALLHALWNAALKRQPDPEAALIVILAFSAVLSVLAIPFAPGPSFSGAPGLVWALAAGLCEGGYFVTLALSLREAPLGVVYPISRGGAVAAVWPASVLWLGESITAASVMGALIVVAGLVLVGGGEGHASRRGVIWAVLCAGFIAGYHLCYKSALSTGAEPTAVFAVALALALPINVIRLGRSGTQRIVPAARASPIILGIAGVLTTASFLVFLSALARGGAGAAITFRNTSVIFTLLLAWAIGEKPDLRQITGTVAVAAGAVLLGWPS